MKIRQILLSFVIILVLNAAKSTIIRSKYDVADENSNSETEREKSAETEEGDMKLTPEQEMAERGIIHLDMALEDLSKWPSTTIPYVFGEGFDGQERIEEAFEEYAKKSCIRFRKKEPQDDDYLYFYNGRGCWSFVGRIGGKQHVSLPRYCRTTLGTPVHEILHALGFYHEQSRADRDKYIKVEWGNIKPRAKGNFEEHEAQDHGYPYDFDSVMHYGDHAFSRNGKTTLRVLKSNGEHHIGQREKMSVIDAAQLNAHYCGGKEGGGKKRDTLAKPADMKRTIMCHPEEGEDCDHMDVLNELDTKEIFHTSDELDAKSIQCNPEEGEVCDDGKTNENIKKEEVAAPMLVEVKKSACNPEEGDVCDEEPKCAKFVADTKSDCGIWAKNGFCKKYNYKDWMAINCATSCEGKCAEK